jgi:hypothetical protein
MLQKLLFFGLWKWVPANVGVPMVDKARSETSQTGYGGKIHHLSGSFWFISHIRLFFSISVTLAPPLDTGFTAVDCRKLTAQNVLFATCYLVLFTAHYAANSLWRLWSQKRRKLTSSVCSNVMRIVSTGYLFSPTDSLHYPARGDTWTSLKRDYVELYV